MDIFYFCPSPDGANSIGSMRAAYGDIVALTAKQAQAWAEGYGGPKAFATISVTRRKKLARAVNFKGEIADLPAFIDKMERPALRDAQLGLEPAPTNIWPVLTFVMNPVTHRPVMPLKPIYTQPEG